MTAAAFCAWHVPHVSISVGRLSWLFAETFVITVWQLVHATSRDSWALPFQNRCLPAV